MPSPPPMPHANKLAVFVRLCLFLTLLLLHATTIQLPLGEDGKLKDGAAMESVTIPISGDGFPPSITEFVSVSDSITSNGIEVRQIIITKKICQQ